MAALPDLRFAARSLARRPAFTLVAAGTLAVGVGATTAIFSVANAVLLRSLPYPAAEELAMIWATEEGGSDEGPGVISSPDVRDIRAGVSSLESVAQFTNSNLTVSGLGPAAEVVPGARASRQLFEVMGAQPVLGRSFTADEDLETGPDAVVVGESFWRERLGGDPEAVGRSLTIAGRPHTIVGVAPAGFEFPADARLWVPLKNNEDGCGRGCTIFAAVARLADGASLEAARSEAATLAGALAEEHPDSNTGVSFILRPLQDVVVGDVRTALWVLLGAVGMVLLIACANVANLVLVRGGSRSVELAVRSAMGASRQRLLGYLMAENALLAALGGVGGLVLGWWGIAALVQLAPEGLPRLDEVGLDPTTLAFAVGVVALTVVVFGLAPALRLSREAPAAAMRGSRGSLSDRRSHRARALVLTAEVGLSVMLLLGAGLMLRSLVRMQAVDIGLATEDIAVFRLSLPDARYEDPGTRVQLLDRFVERLEAVPGIRRAAPVVSLPFTTVNLTGGFAREDLPRPAPGETPSAGYRALSPGAMDALGLEVVEGRGFEEADRHGVEPVALINEAAAERYWPGEEAVGRSLRVFIGVGYPEDGPRRIVGVVRDFRDEVTGTVPPEMYVPYAQVAASFPHVILSLDGVTPGTALEAARRELAALDPELPLIRPGTLEGLVAEQMAASRFYLLLLGLFAVMAVSLAAVGIYGVVAYTVVQRTREIGMRMALGARVRQVVGLVVWQGAAPALAGLLLGVAGALLFGRVMEGILFQVQPTDPMTYLAAAAFISIVVLGATAIPARRATRIPPADALRSE